MENMKKVFDLASVNQSKALGVLAKSGMADIWRAAGCRVNLVGSLRMGLLANHKDIDLHVYSRGITEEGSFAIAAKIARNPNVAEIRCINGLNTDEKCISWHIFYRSDDNEIYKFDIIHIEEHSQYDGFFENMADRIVAVMTDEQRETILSLKFQTPENINIHGVEYYEAVIADNITTLEELKLWVGEHRRKEPYYWIP